MSTKGLSVNASVNRESRKVTMVTCTALDSPSDSESEIQEEFGGHKTFPDLSGPGPAPNQLPQSGAAEDAHTTATSDTTSHNIQSPGDSESEIDGIPEKIQADAEELAREFGGHEYLIDFLDLSKLSPAVKTDERRQKMLEGVISKFANIGKNFMDYLRLMTQKIPPVQIDFLEGKSGIAVVVTTDYKRSVIQRNLDGTEMDGNEMTATLEAFNIQVVRLQNKHATKKNIEAHLEALSTYLKGRGSEMKDKVLIFAFSGHGDHSGDDTEILTDKGPNLLLRKDIIPYFVRDLPHLFHIPKLFFIDACRGGKRIKSYDSDATKDHRNPFLDTEVGNLLIAHATIKHCVSYLRSSWMIELASVLREKKDEPLTVILDDLAKQMHVSAEARDDLEKQKPAKDRKDPAYTQPECVSRLQGSFKFSSIRPVRQAKPPVRQAKPPAGQAEPPAGQAEPPAGQAGPPQPAH